MSIRWRISHILSSVCLSSNSYILQIISSVERFPPCELPQRC
nr:MAG TPA: hypothetical protein [Caudoviricetes sp.]DAP28915.1 MAG TPA: hypothetical protein [Caudoviricetes sp.]DAU54221.1 MAG TPA: hypothetical protein [Bacteriophage sp.]